MLNPRQTIATFQRNQEPDATYRNIVGPSVSVRAFGHPGGTCCDMLGVVGSNLKMVKVRATMLHSGARALVLFSTRDTS